MRVLHTSVVGEDETDSLGHMNVRFYMERVERANDVVMSELGLERKALKARGQALYRVDTYCKYNREQFPGATLDVAGGVLDIADDGARMFYEVRNPQQDAHAATFIIEYALTDLPTRQRLPPPDETLRLAEGARVALPDHGTPRTIKLDPPRLDVTLAEITARVGDGGASMMGGLRQREIEPGVCDEHGFLRHGQDLMFGFVDREKFQADGQRPGPTVNLDAHGRRFGWAWMETRGLVFDIPRVGDVMYSIGADLALGAKTRTSRRWIFNHTTGRLAATDDLVGICLDLDARRAIDIPGDVRTELASVYAPEFA